MLGEAKSFVNKTNLLGAISPPGFFLGRTDELGHWRRPKINYSVLKQPRLRLGTARGAVVFGRYGADSSYRAAVRRRYRTFWEVLDDPF
jgi:hypothetical protein